MMGTDSRAVHRIGRRDRAVPASVPILALFIGLSCLSASSACGQVCFRGKPSPECRLFEVTEVGFGFRLGKTGEEAGA